MNPFFKLFYWYFSRKALPYWCVFILDCLIVFLSGLVIYVLNNGLLHSLQSLGLLTCTLGVYLLFYIIGFRWFRTYSGIIRYSSFIDL